MRLFSLAISRQVASLSAISHPRRPCKYFYRYKRVTDNHSSESHSCRKPTTRTFRLFTLLFAYALFLSSGFAQNVVQWRAPDTAEASLGAPSLNAITFSPDGLQVAIANVNGIALYDTSSGNPVTLFPVLGDDVSALAISPDREKDDGQTVAVASQDAPIGLWDARTGEHLTDFIGHTDPVVGLAFSPDGNTLASGSFREIRLWNLTLEQVSRATILRGHRDMVTTLAFSPDGKTLASTSFYGTILLWDVRTAQLRHGFRAHTDSIQTLAFSPDSEILVSGGYWSPDAESTIRVWNPHTGRLLSTFEDHITPVFALAFSPNSHTVHAPYDKVLASAGWGTAVHIWDPRNGQLQATFEGDAAPVVALAFPPDTHGNYGRTLASASLDGTIQLRPLEPMGTPNQQRDIRVAFRADVNSDGVVNILDLTFVAARFGEDSPDLNGDGVINILDLVLVAQHMTE